MEGVGRGLVQGAGEQDGAVGLAGKIDEGRQAAGEARDGAGGIDDDQAGVQAADETGQVVQVVGESVRAGAGKGPRSIHDEGTHKQEMGGIATGSFEARFEDVGGGVVGSEEQDVALLGGRAIGQGRATGDAGGQGEGQEGEARAGGGIEQGEVTQGDATGPQPGEGLVGHLREELGGGQGSRRFLRRRLLFGNGAFVVGNFALDVASDEVVEVARGARVHGEDPFVPGRRAWRVGQWLRGARLRWRNISHPA